MIIDFSLDDLVEAMHASDGPGPNIMELVKVWIMHYVLLFPCY